MSVLRKGSSVYFECDECGDAGTAEGLQGDDQFRETWSMLREDGWRCHKEDDQWVHNCPECVKAWASNQISNERREEARATRNAIADISERNRHRR